MLRAADNADVTVAAPWVSHEAPVFEVVVACAERGVRHTFRRSVPEIGDVGGSVAERAVRSPPRVRVDQRD